MGKFIDLTGQRFGKLTVVRFVKFNRWNAAVYLCRCDCGCEKIILGASLRSGNTKSCGCLSTRKDGKNNFDRYHVLNPGDSRPRNRRLHSIWLGMRYRCNSTHSEVYKDYGGRGICVCSEWDDFYTFQEWALANGYSDGKSIDRIDNDGNYSPENCRWVDMKIQGSNRRNSRYFTFRGETLTISEWSRRTGIEWNTLNDRIKKGLPPEEIFKPTKSRR